MPCERTGHYHGWPENVLGASLTIARCERFCSYCPEAEQKKDWGRATRLRRHVAKHCKPGGSHSYVHLNPRGLRMDGQPRRSSIRGKVSQSRKSQR
ncbi:hypothetical protein K470DRAFT_206329, partial [Piedraia hortae CBS 480.64]